MVIALGYFAVDRFVLEPMPAQRDLATAVPLVEEPVSAARAPESAEPSIAVLPFVNMSSDPEQDYFSDGLTEELLNLLAGIDELKVAARTSSFYYKNKLDDIPLTEVARQLNVAHVLEGSVRKSGNEIRVTAQLIDAGNGFHVWSETWDRSLDDVFQIQDDIARAVVDQLRLRLLEEVVPHATVVDSKAWDLTLRGRYLFNRRAEGDLHEAMSAFEEAVAIDPNVVEAWVGLAPLYLWLFDPPRIEEAENAVDRALAIDPDSAEAWVRRGTIAWMRRDLRSVRTAAAQALDFGPENPLALAVNASLARTDGAFERARALLERANRVDPLHAVNRTFLADVLMDLEEFEAAESELLRAEQLFPDTNLAVIPRARLSLLQNQPEKALEYLPRAQADAPATSGADDVLMYKAMAFHSLGQSAESNRAMEAFEAKNGDKYPVQVAAAFAWRGEVDKAFDYLLFGVNRTRDYGVGDLLVPELRAVREDPRWSGLLVAYREERAFLTAD
jgi:TolB-like protein/Flp pilus assembly protein TadD